MPAQRLPWFRFWLDATSHEKVRQLDDATFRTWVELLDAAAKQPHRGRFASRQGAVAVVRRPAKHLATLIGAGLIDESADKRLTMHDWDEWQRWRKEDVNDSPTTPEHPPNGHANDSRTSSESPLNGYANSADQHANDPSPRARVAREEDTDRDRDVEEDVDEDVPPVAKATSPRGRRRIFEVDDEFKAELTERFWEAFGSREAVGDCIATAVGYRGARKYTDQRAFLRNWVRSDAEKAALRRGGRNGIAIVPSQSDCTCDEVRANLAINRNSYRICDVHGRVE